MVKITIPTFDGVPKDVVETLDAYEEVSNDVKNSLESNITAFKEKRDDLLDKALAGTRGLTDSTKAMVDKANGYYTDTKAKVDSVTGTVKDTYDRAKGITDDLNATYNKAKASVNGLFTDLESGRDLLQIKDRISAALKGDRSSLLALGNDAEKLFATNVLGLDGTTGLVTRGSEAFNKVQVLKGKVNHYFGNDSPLRVNNVLSFINDIGDGETVEFLDLGSEGSLLGSVIVDIQDWGVPDLLDDVFKAKVNDEGVYDYGYSEDFRFAVGQSVSGSITESSDLGFVRKLVEHAGPQSLLATNPDFPIQLIAGYTFPDGIVPGESDDPTVKTYSSELETLVTTLDLIKPDWFNVTRGSESVWNLYFISVASADAATLLKQSDVYRDAMLTAPFYRMDSFRSVARQLYPLIALEH